jgi:hypothetical protein
MGPRRPNAMIKRDRASIESVIAMIQTRYSDDTKGMDVELGTEMFNCVMEENCIREQI